MLSALEEKVKTIDVPVLEPESLQITLGVLNCIIFGLGVLIAGIVKEDRGDIIIGLLQMLLPFLGWIWAIVWGITMIVRRQPAGAVQNGDYEPI